MADRSSHKHRHSTPPSPPTSEPAANVSASVTMRPPSKKGKRESREENPQPQRANDEYHAPSIPRDAFAPQTHPGPRARNPSCQTIALPSTAVFSTQQHEGSGAEETVSAVPRPQPPMASIATFTRPGVIMPQHNQQLMPQNNQQLVSQYVQLSMPEEGPSAPGESETLAFMRNFVFDALALSPLSFPPAPLNSEPEVYQPVTQAAAPRASMYPEIEPWMQTGYTTPPSRALALPAPTSATQQPIFPPPPNPATAHPRPAPALLQRPINPAAQNTANPTPVVPIEPILVSENYLWTQVEAAQVTMVGTLTALLMRQRAGELESGVDDLQVQNVTSNLINIMSLWYMLRRDSGWPL